MGNNELYNEICKLKMEIKILQNDIKEINKNILLLKLFNSINPDNPQVIQDIFKEDEK
jgi:hypothetical protein